MINLLDNSDKKIIRQEYHRRLFRGYALGFGALLVIALISVSAYYGAQKISAGSLLEMAERQKSQSDLVGVETFVADIKEANKAIGLIAGGMANVHSLSAVFDQVISSRGTGIKLTAFDFSKNETGQWSLKLNGVYSRRQDVIAFTSALKSNAIFSSVDSPFSNLIKESNGEFVVTMNMSAPKK